jgi:hypothetical protein
MNEFGIISLILGISFLVFALLVKPENKTSHHEK